MAKKRASRRVSRIVRRSRRAASRGMGGMLGKFGVAKKALAGAAYAYAEPYVDSIGAMVPLPVHKSLKSVAVLFVLDKVVRHPIVHEVASAGAAIEGYQFVSTGGLGGITGASASGGSIYY